MLKKYVAYNKTVAYNIISSIIYQNKKNSQDIKILFEKKSKEGLDWEISEMKESKEVYSISKNFRKI